LRLPVIRSVLHQGRTDLKPLSGFRGPPQYAALTRAFDRHHRTTAWHTADAWCHRDPGSRAYLKFGRKLGACGTASGCAATLLARRIFMAELINPTTQRRRVRGLLKFQSRHTVTEHTLQALVELLSAKRKYEPLSQILVGLYFQKFEIYYPPAWWW